MIRVTLLSKEKDVDKRQPQGYTTDRANHTRAQDNVPAAKYSLSDVSV